MRVFPRGHWYQIVAVKPGDEGQVCLTLDHTRVLSRGLVVGITEQEIVIKTRLPLAWAGYFRRCTLEGPGGTSLPIEDVRMREDQHLGYAILGMIDPADRCAIAAGSWADFVDYTPGDKIVG